MKIGNYWKKAVLKSRMKYCRIVHKKLFEDIPCMIQPNHPSFGFFGHYINIIGILKAEIEKGNKPYIDMGYYPNCYLREEDIGKENTWEWYFEQPFGELDEDEEIKDFVNKLTKTVALGKNLFLCKQRGNTKIVKLIRDYHAYGKFQRPDDTCDFLTNQKAVEWWQKFAHRYTRFNEKTSKHIDEMYKELFSGHKRVLGVLLRGTDYSDNKPYNHPIPPTMEEAIQKIRKVLKEKEYDSIFLVTEDERILAEMKSEFGEKVFCSPQKRYGYTNQKYLNEIYAEDEARDPFQMGLDYVTAIALLGKCNAMMASRTSGAVAALVLAEKFEYTFFWNNGRYGTAEYND